MTAALAGPAPGVCGPETFRVCEWVYDRTGSNATLASAADWLVGRPLAIVGVLALGWLARLVIRRLVARGVNRLLARGHVLVPLRGSFGTGKASPRQPFSDPMPEREEARRTTRARAVATAVSGGLSALVWAIAVITVAGILGVDLGPVIAGAGLAGVAIAFGAQSLIQDLLAGVLILLEDHFGIGDEVDLGEAVGVVEAMSLRETVLRDLDGTVWHVRNGKIDRVGNQSQVWSGAMVNVQVAHGADVQAARRALLEAATQVAARPPFADEVLAPPELLGVEALDQDGVTLLLRVRTLAGRQFELQRALLEATETAFTTRGIPLATPHLTVRAQFSPTTGDG
ncbi:mechanosensitive ion channel [Pseudonocardia ailaonensis]|uniref:Mechanosensitive ion channel n=1 Tax=Pseudonocardia ailaonensis TaxID=367279 RepID=A0ABN2NPU5_9PSEU